MIIEKTPQKSSSEDAVKLASSIGRVVEQPKRFSGENAREFLAASRLFDIIDDVLLTGQQLADKLNVSIKTIRKWRFEKEMPPDCMLKVGKHLVRYRWVNVQRWLQLQGD